MNPPISTTQAEESALEGAIWLSTWVGFGLVGALVVSRCPANRIGWIMSGITLAVGLSLFADEYSRFALVTEPGSWPLGEPAAWLATWGFLPVVALVMTLVVMYPSGDPSRFGRRILRTFLFVTLADACSFLRSARARCRVTLRRTTRWASLGPESARPGNRVAEHRLGCDCSLRGGRFGHPVSALVGCGAAAVPLVRPGGRCVPGDVLGLGFLSKISFLGSRASIRWWLYSPFGGIGPQPR